MTATSTAGAAVLNIGSARGHSVTDVDVESRTGTCHVCGPAVRVRPNRDRRRGDLIVWRCKIGETQRPGYGALRARSALKQDLRRRFGITPDEYQQRLAAQAGLCAICGSAAAHLDHDHQSGELREFLCRPCNVGLGHFGDDANRLRAAAEYLDRHRGTGAQA